MATVYQCDRCGKQQSAKLQKVDLPLYSVFLSTWELCPECIEKLRKFMEAK